MVEFAYSVGQAIEVLDQGGRWRPACVLSLAPGRGRAGYYIGWSDIDYATCRQNDAPLPSSGGWTYELCMRIPAAAADEGVER